MADINEQAPTNEGHVAWEIPGVGKTCETWYKIYGDISSGGSPPLVVVHGGPGIAHGYLSAFATLWSQHNIPVIFYDQIGCGQSTRFPNTAGNEALWRQDTFVTELEGIVDHLHLHDGQGFYLLGHSFGGGVAAQYATTQPRGLLRLVLANASPSTRLSAEGNLLNVKTLPENQHQAITRAMETNDFEDQEYKAAFGAWLMKFTFGGDPVPAAMLPALMELEADASAQKTMGGSSPFTPGGTMRDVHCIPQLSRILVPTLIYNGDCDSSHAITQKAFFDNIPRVRQVVFAGASHMPHLQDAGRSEKVLKLVGEFLTTKVDVTGGN
ncbi:hypothetical protein ANO11243_061490 [Dothideomycetidae sp. 11243]|nr:hypothetical protein ANO11243_061490 [fungal sp. No.11243]